MKKLLVNFCKFIINKLIEKPKEESNFISGENLNKISINNIIIKKCVKIPKQCYFISVGDKPSYFDLSVDSFKNTNDNIKVEILNYTYDDFFKHKYTWNILVSNGFQKCKMLSKQQIDIVIKNFAIKLLYEYGGIYLNSKTFTVRNLEYILNNNRFIYSAIYKDYKIYKNYNMFGGIKGFNEEENMIYPPMDYNMNLYETIKTSFLNNNLKNEMFNFNNVLNQCPVYTFDINS